MKATGKTFTELYFMIDKKGIRETGNSGRVQPAFSGKAIGITGYCNRDQILQAEEPICQTGCRVIRCNQFLFLVPN